MIAAPSATESYVAVSPAALQDAPLSTTTAKMLIYDAAARYGANGDRLYRTLRCESRLTDAIGDGGTSFGIAQIHLSAHPEVTRFEAMDERWSIIWSAKAFAAGEQSMWSCYRILY